MSAHLESRLREILREQRRGQVMDVERSCVNTVTAGVELHTARSEFVEGRARLRAVAETLDGDVIESPSGPCVVIDRFYPADHCHGTIRIGDVRGLALSTRPELTLVGGIPSSGNSAPSPLLFVDLETTGLAGGAGTYAFLVGCAYFEPHGFRIRQYFLGAFQHERTLLNEIDGLVRRSAGLVSYNGKSFDVPVLETRFQFNRLAPPFEGYAHVDMLHVARRFWRSAPAAPGAWPDTDSCRLSTLERLLFGVRRVGDVQGFEIPNRYFDYVRSGNAERLEPVFEHNRLDLLSLAMVTARALQVLEDAPARCTSARESLAAGRILEGVGRLGDAERCFADAIDRSRSERGAAAGSVRADAMRHLALRYRRSARFSEAADLWRAIVVEREATPIVRREALEALAIHFEHRARNLSEAHRFARLSLAERIGTRSMGASRHRLARLDRKLAKLPGPCESGRLWQEADGY